MAQVLLTSDSVIIQKAYSLKFYKTNELTFLDSYSKWIGFEKVTFFIFKTARNEHFEISDKLLQFEGLREKLLI